MRYIALLRGINVGGNNIIKMADLKEVCEKIGFQNVQTYIQSGNVIFDSDETSAKNITEKLEQAFSIAFNYKSRVIVRSFQQMKKVLQSIPEIWKTEKDIRCYVAFVKEPTVVDDVMKEIEVKEGVDFAEAGPGVVYMTTLMSGLTKSKFSKLVGKKIFQEVTIRNYNTTRKVLDLME